MWENVSDYILCGIEGKFYLDFNFLFIVLNKLFRLLCEVQKINMVDILKCD